MWIDLNVPMDDCDFFIRLVPFPAKKGRSHGATVSNPDGTYSMYLDANADRSVQLHAYWHEYEHIAYEDFDNDKDIEEIEEI
jgi:hypothetical protein